MGSTSRLILSTLLFLSVLAMPAGSQVTTGIFGHSAPSISGDGRYVAVGSFGEIFVVDRVTGSYTRVSVNSRGEPGNGVSRFPSSSYDGNRIAFESRSDNLVAVDTNDRIDIFVHDSQTGETVIVSVDSNGGQSSEASRSPSISGDGRFVAFHSFAEDLVLGDSNRSRDVFVHELETGRTRRVSIGSDGTQGNGDSFDASISSNGRFIAFQSKADNLVPDDTNGSADIFIHDCLRGETTLVSVDSSGRQAHLASQSPYISGDGRFVVYESFADNLVPGDANGVTDVFIHDRFDGSTSRVSVSSDEVEGNDSSIAATLSADGRYVAFESRATNLVANDTNRYTDVFVHDCAARTTRRVSISTDGRQGIGWSNASMISANGQFVVFYSAAILTHRASGLYVHGTEFTLQSTPLDVRAGEPLVLEVFEGLDDDLVTVWVTNVNGAPILYPLVLDGRFNDVGLYRKDMVAPDGLASVDVTFQAFCKWRNRVIPSNAATVRFR